MARVKSAPTKNSDNKKTTTLVDGQRKRKFKKWKAGTVALRQIKHEQKSPDFAIPGAAFRRLVSEIVQKMSLSEGIRIKREVYKMLQTASEDYLIDIFRDGQAIAIENGKITLSAKDVKRAAKYQRQIYDRIVATSN